MLNATDDFPSTMKILLNDFLLAALLALTFPFGATIAAEETPSAPAEAEKAETKPAEPAAEGQTILWHADFSKAKELAIKDKRDLFLDFTGSDWCTFCIQLKEEVLDKPDFQAAVKDKFVFVEVDFPQSKKQDPKIADQNEKLSEQYQIDGYPTIILTDHTGKPYATAGYQEGGTKAYLEKLTELQQVRIKRDAALEKAGKLEGLEKAKALQESMESMEPELVLLAYADVVDQIIALDTEDTLGVRKKREFNNAFKQLETSLGAMDTTEGVIPLVDKFIAEHKPTGEALQKVLMMKLQSFSGGDKLDEAAEVLKKVIAVDEKTETASAAKDFLDSVTEMKAAAEDPKQK